MTQENKQLLLRDLCARLPYGVKVCTRFNAGSRYTTNVTAISADRDYIQIRQNVLHPYTGSSVEDIRPYLRPMSSMTEEEKEEYDKFFTTITAKEANFGKWISPADDVALIDWYNKHHFDYRGLIEKGLALEAPEGIYKND